MNVMTQRCEDDCAEIIQLSQKVLWADATLIKIWAGWLNILFAKDFKENTMLELQSIRQFWTLSNQLYQQAVTQITLDCCLQKKWPTWCKCTADTYHLIDGQPISVPQLYMCRHHFLCHATLNLNSQQFDLPPAKRVRMHSTPNCNALGHKNMKVAFMFPKVVLLTSV